MDELAGIMVTTAVYLAIFVVLWLALVGVGWLLERRKR